MDLVLRYSLEQRATYLDDPIEAAVQHWQIEVVAEQFQGDGDEPVSSPIGLARVTIVARHQGASLYEAFDAIGFEHFKDGVWVLDLSAINLHTADGRPVVIAGQIGVYGRVEVRPRLDLAPAPVRALTSAQRSS
jgi:hypothetical protein